MAYYTSTISDRITYAFLKAFIAVLSVGLGAIIAAYWRDEPSHFLQYGNLLAYIGAFFVIFIFLAISQDKTSIKLTKTQIEIEIEKQKLVYPASDIKNIAISGRLAKKLALNMKNGATKKIKLAAFTNRKIKSLINDLVTIYPDLNITRR